MRAALHDEPERHRGVPRLSQALHRLGAGGDILRGEFRFRGVGRQQRGDLGDGRVVAADETVRRVGDRRREGSSEGVDGRVVGVAREMESWVGVGLLVHRAELVSDYLTFNVVLADCHRPSDVG